TVLGQGRSRRVLQFEGRHVLPALVVELAVEERPRRDLPADGERLGRRAVAFDQPQLRGGGLAPRVGAGGASQAAAVVQEAVVPLLRPVKVAELPTGR